MIEGIDVRIHEDAEFRYPDRVWIGSHVAIDKGVYVSTGISIGDYCHIAHGVSIIGGEHATMIMYNFTNIGAGAKIVVISDDFTQGMINPIVPVKYRKLIGSSIIMHPHTIVGTNSVVFPNVTMMEGSVLGANSLLRESTEPWTIYAGSPARPIGKRDKELIMKATKELGYDV
jgi:galactoside O-acetyltransferase